MSKVTVIPISNHTLPPEIKQRIKAAKVKDGDTLRFLFNGNGMFAAMLVTIIVGAVYSVLKGQKKTIREKEGDDVLNSILNGTKTKDELEQEIAAEYGVNLEFEIANSQKTNPLDAAFGIWEDHKVTIEQIREKAWPKRA